MPQKFKVNKTILKSECYWLNNDIPEGTELYEYTEHTYGCIGDGIACSMLPNKTPFFEVPLDNLDLI